jgi:hypothetical protein
MALDERTPFLHLLRTRESASAPKSDDGTMTVRQVGLVAFH